MPPTVFYEPKNNITPFIEILITEINDHFHKTSSRKKYWHPQKICNVIMYVNTVLKIHTFITYIFLYV